MSTKIRRLRARTWIVLLGCSLGFVGQVWAVSNITSIDFKGTSSPNQIEIRADGPVSVEKQENPADNQVVLEIKGAQISKNVARKIDTSSFNSKVSLISPYQVEGQSETVRVVLQMREAAGVDVAQEGNAIRVNIPGNGPGNGASSESVAAAPPTDAPPAEAPPAEAPPPPPADVAAADAKTAAPEQAQSTGPKSELESFMESKSAKKFTGRPITLQVRDVDVADIFRLIGEASGFNIIVGDDVKGKLTLSLVDVPWDQALDVVLNTLKLGAERNNNILRIVTLANLTQEKQEQLRAAQAADAVQPRVTRVFPISYADLKDLQTILEKFAASTQNAQGGTVQQGQPAIIQVDNRTNSLVVRDTPDNIERMKKLIAVLDTQTPQVMIEAKIVEAREGFSKALGGSLGFGQDGGATGLTSFASFAGANPLDALIGGPFSSGNDIAAVSKPSSGIPNGTFGLSPSISFIPGVQRVNALISYGESESQAKVVSSPKTVVLNKQKANIVQGTPVLIPSTTTVAGVGTVATNSVQSANLSLAVKPTVTNDGGVLMELQISNDSPAELPGGGTGIANKNLSTIVLADSGSTLVIGGVYTMSTSKTGAGFPFLRKIPIIGALFGSETDSTSRSELFIFITPRILNVREAGLNG